MKNEPLQGESSFSGRPSEEVALFAVLKDLPTAKVVQEVNDKVLVAIKGVLSGSDGVILAYRESDQCSFISDEKISSLWSGKKLPLHSCIAGWTILHELPAIVDNLLDDYRVGSDSEYSSSIKSVLVVPIKKNASMGALGVYWEKPHHPTAVELERLEILAESMAVSLQNVSLYEQLSLQNRRKDEFMSMLAHELRNPLSPILYGVQILRLKNQDAATKQEVCEMMERQVHQLSTLINHLLDVSRVSRGKITLNSKKLDIVDLVRSSLQDYKGAFQKAKISLSVDLSRTPLWITGDSLRLSQVLGSLFENAAKFSNEGGMLSVTVRREGGEVVISVKDTGIGISSEILPTLFEPFSQAERTIDKSRGGLGLGLSLVKGLTELHGGKVEVKSPGENLGAEFLLHLPLTEESLREPQSSPPEELGDKHLKILVIEDNTDSAATLRMLLEHAGHQVTLADDGLRGVKAAQSVHPDLVVCDIGLPEMDGFEVAKELRKQHDTSHARLVALSGYSREEDKLKAFESGFDAHLTKPVDFDALMRQIDLVGQ